MKLKDSASNVHNCVKNGTTNERGEKISVTLPPNPIQSVPLMKQCIRRIDCLRSACDKNCTRQHCISSTRLENFRYFSEDGKIFLYLLRIKITLEYRCRWIILSKRKKKNFFPMQISTVHPSTLRIYQCRITV